MRTIVDLADQEDPLAAHPNEYALIHDGQTQKQIAKVFRQNEWQTLRPPPPTVTCLNLEQSCLMDSLMEASVQVVAASGYAGTGKTYLALAAALKLRQAKPGQGLALRLIKPYHQVGSSKAIGILPGTLAEKTMPYLASYLDVFEELGLSEDHIASDLANKRLFYEHLELVRGRTFRNSIVILDEAQNLSWHELYTLITRLGKNSKLIVLGDLDQIDISSARRSNGFSQLMQSEVAKWSPLFAQHHLSKTVRSEVAQFAHDVNMELSGNNMLHGS